jgi:hypothetical protein
MIKPVRRWITWYLVLAFLVIGMTPRAYAGFSPSEVLALSPENRAADLKQVQRFLETKIVVERLRELGLSPGEIQSRLDQIHPDQLHQIALKVDELTVGGDGLGIIIALLVIAILVVVIIQLTGHRVVVK